MPQLPFLTELRAPHQLTVNVTDNPLASEPTSSVTVVVRDRKGSVLAGAACTLKGIECDYIPTIVEGAVMAHLFAEPSAVEQAVVRGAREARAHARAHERG